MGFAKDDAEGIFVVIVLAIVFAWMFAIVWRLYIIGVILTVLIIIVAFIFQSLRAWRRKNNGKSQQEAP